MGACLRARLEMIFSTRRLKEEMGAHLEGRLELLLVGECIQAVPHQTHDATMRSLFSIYVDPEINPGFVIRPTYVVPLFNYYYQSDVNKSANCR